MNLGRPRPLAVAALALACALAGASAARGYAPRVVTGGRTVLGVTGLAVDLPGRPADPSVGAGVRYDVSGRWSLSATGTFAGRDTIDVLSADGTRLVSAVWVAVGHGDPCAQALEDHALTRLWDAELTLFGARWGAHGGTYAFEGGLGTRPVVVLCGAHAGKGADLVMHAFVLAGDARPLNEGEWSARLAQGGVVGAVYAAYRDGQSEPTRPTADESVRQPVVTLEAPGAARKVRLATNGLDVALPDDGFVWALDSAASQSGVGVDLLRRVAPAMPDVAIEVSLSLASECNEKFAQRGREVDRGPAPIGVPSELVLGPLVMREAGPTRMVCKVLGTRALFVGIAVPGTAADRPSDLAPCAPVVMALVRAAEAAPEPRSPVAAPPAGPDPEPGTPQPPSMPYVHRGPLRDAVLVWFELEAPVSWRDATVASDGRSAPSPRVTFPSIDLGSVLSSQSGFMLRLSLALGVDLVGATAGHGAPTTSPRYGGQRWEVLMDFGYGLNLGDWARLGLTLGWHGLSGPLTTNSSLAASLYGLVAPSPDTCAFMLRVTPMQLVASNERNFLSPLTIESRFIYGPFSMGVEGQWIDAPRPGDQDIPSRGFALLFRLGYGQSDD